MSEKKVVLGLLKKLGKPKVSVVLDTADLKKILWSAVDLAIENDTLPEGFTDAEMKLLDANGYDVFPDGEQPEEKTPEPEESQEEEAPPEPKKETTTEGKNMTKKKTKTKKAPRKRTKKKAAAKKKSKKPAKKTTPKKPTAKKKTKKKVPVKRDGPGMAAWFRNLWERAEKNPIRRKAIYRRFIKQFGEEKKITVTNYITYAKADNQYNPLPWVLTETVNDKGQRVLKRGKAAKKKAKKKAGRKSKTKTKPVKAAKKKSKKAKAKKGKSK